MYAALLTVILTTGADAQTLNYGGGYGYSGGYYGGNCEGSGPVPGRAQPMPQTCYHPRYGCYAGSRYMHRHTAFHGLYYRKPYNYRNYFDYPWHAEMHEPTSYYSFNVGHQQQQPANNIGATSSRPAPPPGARRPNNGMRSASRPPQFGRR